MSKTYKPFTEKTVIPFVQSLQLFKETDPLLCEEIGDGNLNLVFRIRHQETGSSIIVKQALPYAKVVGTSWPLTLDRARIEGEALKNEYKLVPQYTPKVYYTDKDYAVTVMEDLSHLTILRKGLIQRKNYPNLSKDIGHFLAHTLFFTSDYGLNQQEKKLFSSHFINPELCKITEDLVFTDPFFDHDTNNFPEELRPFIEDVIWSDEELKLEVAKLKRAFLTKGEALLHGDLHTGSIFADETTTKVIDPEFAYFGPMGFDIGAFIANLVLNYISQFGHTENIEEREAYQQFLLTSIKETWTTFAKEFTALWANTKHQQEAYMRLPAFKEAVLDEVFRDTIGFAGCKVIRRIIGLAHVEDIESIADEEKKLAAKKLALQIGKALILKRFDLQTMEDLIKVVEQK